MLDADAGLRLSVETAMHKLSTENSLTFSVIRLLSLPETRSILNGSAVRALIDFYTHAACVAPCRNGRGRSHVLVTSVIPYV